MKPSIKMKKTEYAQFLDKVRNIKNFNLRIRVISINERSICSLLL